MSKSWPIWVSEFRDEAEELFFILFQKLYKLFLWASGADLEILKQAPTDNNKYFGIGGTIIFTAFMATFAGGYAFLLRLESKF